MFTGGCSANKHWFFFIFFALIKDYIFLALDKKSQLVNANTKYMHICINTNVNGQIALIDIWCFELIDRRLVLLYSW